MSATFVKTGFNSSTVSQRFEIFFGTREMIQVRSAILSISDLTEVREQYNNPFDYASYVVAEFLELSQEFKKDDGFDCDVVDFYCAESSKIDLFKSLPKAAQEILEGLAENRNAFAENKNPHLENLAGVFYLYGIGGNVKESEAFVYFQKAAKSGYKPAQSNLELCYLKGSAVKKDVRKALDLCKKINVSGSDLIRFDRTPEELFAISEYYNDFLGHETLLIEEVIDLRSAALGYCRLASNAGYAPAQCRFAVHIIEASDGKKMDAVNLFRVALQQEYMPAAYELGKCYLSGIGVEKSLVEAMEYFKFAADFGVASAQCELGKRYAVGDGCEKDHAKALKFFVAAIDSDSEEAVRILSKPAMISFNLSKFFFVDPSFLKSSLTKEEIIEVVHVLGTKTLTAKRLQDPRSELVGKLTKANCELLTLVDLLKINKSLARVINDKPAGIFQVFLKQESESLKAIQACMFKKIEDFLEKCGVKKAEILEKKFNFKYADGDEIVCEFSGVEELGEVVKSFVSNPENCLSGNCLSGNKFSLIFNEENLERVTRELALSSDAVDVPSTRIATRGAAVKLHHQEHFLSARESRISVESLHLGAEQNHYW